MSDSNWHTGSYRNYHNPLSYLTFISLEMFPISKKSESNILAQDPAQNSTTERTSALHSLPRTCFFCSAMWSSPFLDTVPALLCFSACWPLQGELFHISNRTGVLLIFYIWINSIPGSFSLSFCNRRVPPCSSAPTVLPNIHLMKTQMLRSFGSRKLKSILSVNLELEFT